MSNPESTRRRERTVSVWVGTFHSMEAAEAYFGMDVEVYLPPEAFQRDLGIDDLPAENLEVHFEQLPPRPIEELLAGATFAASFRGPAAEAASRLGILEAQGIALLYDFDYQASPDRRPVAGPLTFLGSFPFDGDTPADDQAPIRDPSIRVREIVDDVL